MRFLLNIPDKLREDLKKLATERGQTLNGLIRQILWEWLQKNNT